MLYSNDEMSKKIRLLVGDNHVLTRQELTAFLDEQPDITLVGEASNSRMALELCAAEQPDIAILDLQMPGMDDLEVVKHLREKQKSVRVIGMAATMQEDEVFRALEAGVQGYLPRKIFRADLLEAIRTVYKGWRWIALAANGRLADWLTRARVNDQKLDVLKLFSQGESHPEARGVQMLSQDAIKSHMKMLLEKLGAHEDSRAAICAMLR